MGFAGHKKHDKPQWPLGKKGEGGCSVTDNPGLILARCGKAYWPTLMPGLTAD